MKGDSLCAHVTDIMFSMRSGTRAGPRFRYGEHDGISAGTGRGREVYGIGAFPGSGRACMNEKDHAAPSVALFAEAST